MAASQHARSTDKAPFSDLEVLMIAYFQKHPPKIPVEDKKTLLAYLKDTYLTDQESFKRTATALIEESLVFEGTFSAFIKRTKPSSKPAHEINADTLKGLIDKFNEGGTHNKFLDVTQKNTVRKKGEKIKGGIPMPDPTEGEVVMKSTGKRDYRNDPSLLPRPELTPQASANRNKKPANLRLYEEFLKEVDDAAKEVSMTRTAWIEEAIQEKLVSQRKLKM